MRKHLLLLHFAFALSIWSEGASAHDLTAQKIDATTIALSGSISLSNGCISFAGIEVSTPQTAPKLQNTAVVVTRLTHSGFQTCTQNFRTVPVELQVPRPDRHPADKRPEYVVNYTIVEGTPDGAVLFEGLSGEIIVVEE